MCFLKRAFYGLLLLCACAGNGFATPLFIQSGTWIVDSELNGLPGRGMAIDVQNQHLVMQVYNYNRAGRPTFHLASGPLNGLQFKGPLSQYRGGRFFGSGERVGWEDEVAGEVRIRFESSTSGFIQFPGEPEVAMSRFRFDGVADGFLLKPDFRESWVAMEFDEADRPTSAWHIDMYRDPANGDVESLLLASSPWYESSLATSNPCTSMGSGGWVRCNVTFERGAPEQQRAVFEIRKSVHGLEGFVTRAASPQTRTRLRGSKYASYDAAADVSHRMLHQRFQGIRFSEMRDSGMHFYVPEPGTWIVSQELNGKPGRGMAIDVQNGNFVMQVYNYESNGSPSFHLAVGKMTYDLRMGVGTTASPDVKARLKRYAGGRYFGGPALTGREVADVGEVQLAFQSPLRGQIKFPGEDWVAIEKFQFGYGAANPEALLGLWAFQAMGEGNLMFELSRVEGEFAKGDSASCHYYQREPGDSEYPGIVRCYLRFLGSPTSQFIFNFDASVENRAVPAFSTYQSMGFTYYPHKGFAVQVRDKNGTPIGFDRVRH